MPRNQKDRQRPLTTITQVTTKVRDNDIDNVESANLENDSRNESSRNESSPNLIKGQEDETFLQSEVFDEEKHEKTDEEDATSEMDQADINNDDKWDTDIEQEGLNF